MPIKKTKQNQSIKKKKIRFKIDRKFLYYSIGIIILLALFFVFYKRDREDQKKLTGKTFIPKKEIEGKRIEISSIPYVEKAKLELISSDNNDIIKVIIDKKNPHISYRYQWKINGKIIENYNKDSISGFKEGDTIGVTITPFKEDLMGEPRFFSLTVQSTVPKVLGHTEPKIENQIMVFRILTEETKGLSFSLNKAPKGMTINQGTGEVAWNVKDISPGRYEVEVIIKNKKGAQVLYPLFLNLG